MKRTRHGLHLFGPAEHVAEKLSQRVKRDIFDFNVLDAEEFGVLHGGGNGKDGHGEGSGDDSGNYKWSDDRGFQPICRALKYLASPSDGTCGEQHDVGGSQIVDFS